MAEDREYVLGTDQKELERLRLQHELWVDEARSGWREAGFGPGQHLLDLGCGPGFTSLDLAAFVGPTSRVTSVDLSKNFLDHLAKRAGEPGVGRIDTHHSAIDVLNLPKKNHDGAYARWLFSFIPSKDRRASVRAMASHLCPGARVVLQEYVAYESMALCPEFAGMPEVVDAIFKSWRAQGGEPNVARELPAMMSDEGFRILKLSPILRVARPHEPLWAWPDTFYANFIPRLVETGFLKAPQAEAFFKAWKEASQSKTAYFLAPSVMTIVAERSA